MSIWRQLAHGLRSLVHREAADLAIRDEVKQFLDEAVAELVAGGVSPEEARRTVRLRYGTAQAAREELRSFGWENTVTSVLADLRYGARLLRRTPGFTTVVVLTLGLGIGAATAIFSAVSPVLFEPLAYPHAERILSIADRSAEGAPVPVTFGTYRELVERSRAFEALSVFKPWQPTATATGNGEPERLHGQRVSASFFKVLGVAPALGRDFDASDDRRGGPDVVVLSHGLWRRRFGGDSTIIDRYVALDGATFRVLGVMPREFENVPPHPAQVWSLLQYDASLPSFDGREWGHHLNMVGRLRTGVDADVARDELERIAANPIPERVRPPWASMGQGLSLRSLRETATAGARPMLLALLGAVATLLVIACVNVASLLLARGARRRGEMAVRAALGAASPRLFRQLLTEGLLLVVLGGAAGLVFAWSGLGALVSLSPPGLPRADNITLDGSAFAFAAAVTGLIGIIVGMVPVVMVARGNLHCGLREASGRTTGSHIATRRALVVAQVGLASVLLAGAGLLLRSMQRLSAVPTGFDTSSMVVMLVQTSDRFGDDDAVHRFFAQSLAAVRELPGVVSAALTSQLPLSGDIYVYGVTAERDTRSEAGHTAAYRYAVSPGYFETMGIPVVRGRGLFESAADGLPSVVVSESLARSAFDGRDPIGQRVHVGRTDLPWYTVVGVVGDVKQLSLETGSAEAAYIISNEWYFADPALWIVVRAAGDATGLIPSIKEAIWSVDAHQPIVRIAAMEDIVVDSESRRRFALITLEAFALLALVLAAIGIYGVVSGSVNERWHEIGIRSALGASRQSILALVIRQGMTLTAVGLVIGLTGAAIASETVVTLLFGVSRLDPITYFGVVAVLASAAGVACWIPASRAAAIDPAQTLRAE